MRYLELLLTDVADHDGPDIRHQWVHRDHIETIEPYLHARPGRRPMLWLELTLTSGRTRYLPLQPVRPEDADQVARSAIIDLLESGTQPLHAAELRRPGAPTASSAQRARPEISHEVPD